MRRICEVAEVMWLGHRDLTAILCLEPVQTSLEHLTVITVVLDRNEPSIAANHPQ